jgi:hypothetical protein
MVENYANGNTINSMIGSQGWAYSNGTASINYLSGAWFGSQAGAGTVTGLDGLAVSSTVSGATVTAQTGLNVSLANSSGTLGYRYGIFLNTPTGAAPTSGDFGIYQQSTSGKNYFGAQTGIGTVGPQGKLEVRSGSDFNAITLSTNVADGNDTGGVITGKRKTNSNSPFGALATWDWGTERKVYIGGGNWNMPSATQVSIYAQPSYDETTNTYEELFQVDGSGYTNIYGPWTSFNRWGDNTYGHWQEFYKARGTRSAPTAVLSGDDLGNIWAGAYNGTNWSSNGGARISFSASENQTATNGGTRISFHTTPNGSQTISTAMTISDQGYVGIGTTSPGTGLHVVGTGMRMQRNNDTAGNGAAISLYRSRGTSSSPAAVQTGDSLGEVWGYGHDGSAYGSGGGMQIEADGNWTGTSRPNRLKLFTTPTGATANSTRMTILENGNVGINTTAPTHRLHVIGTAGLSTGTAWTNTSDLRLKDVHGEYKIGLQEILKLKTVRFSYKKNNPLGLESDRVITGFVAQEVQQVIPEAVNIREDGYLELNVDPIHWATVNAVQELHGLCQMSGEQSQELSNRVAQHDREITTLKRQVQSLKEENAALKEAVCEINPNANICK